MRAKHTTRLLKSKVFRDQSLPPGYQPPSFIAKRSAILLTRRPPTSLAGNNVNVKWSLWYVNLNMYSNANMRYDCESECECVLWAECCPWHKKFQSCVHPWSQFFSSLSDYEGSLLHCSADQVFVSKKRTLREDTTDHTHCDQIPQMAKNSPKVAEDAPKSRTGS